MKGFVFCAVDETVCYVKIKASDYTNYFLPCYQFLLRVITGNDLYFYRNLRRKLECNVESTSTKCKCKGNNMPIMSKATKALQNTFCKLVK